MSQETEKGIFAWYRDGEIVGFEVRCCSVTRIGSPGARLVAKTLKCHCGSEFDIEAELRKRIDKQRKADGRPKLQADEPGEPSERYWAARDLPASGSTIRFL